MLLAEPRRTKAKTATPCTRCGDRYGAKNGKGYPSRYDGLRYGVPGPICGRCRNRFARGTLYAAPATRDEIEWRKEVAHAAKVRADVEGWPGPLAELAVFRALDLLDGFARPGAA